MKFSFDHLVWYFKKPEKAISPLKQKGIHTIQGGRHETWGTYNSLAYFGLSYIEFLGIENLSIAKNHHENRLVTHIVEQLSRENHEGPARIAIRTDKIEELAVKFKEESFTVYGPLPGERVLGDGQVIRWSLLFVENADSELPLPFFIQWEKSDQVRLHEFEEQGLLINPLFESVGFVVRDLNQTIKTWEKLFEFTQTEEFIDHDLNARCKKLMVSGTNLLFCTPMGDGLALKVLKERGETPFLVNLTNTSESDFFEMMNGYWRFQSNV
jgi:hypothetical protein